jgi:hypothetical protein
MVSAGNLPTTVQAHGPLLEKKSVFFIMVTKSWGITGLLEALS